MNLHWRPAGQINRRILPPLLRDLLFDSGSLTLHLEQQCAGTFSLELLGQSWQRPQFDEVRALDLRPGAYAWIREITFQCNQHPCVYGRSIIPASTLTGAERRLGDWGQRSLGDYLFSTHRVRRGRFEIAAITPADRLFHIIKKNVASIDSELWGRRSLFFINHKPLLVVEIFLAGVDECMHPAKK